MLDLEIFPSQLSCLKWNNSSRSRFFSSSEFARGVTAGARKMSSKYDFPTIYGRSLDGVSAAVIQRGNIRYVSSWNFQLYHLSIQSSGIGGVSCSKDHSLRQNDWPGIQDCMDTTYHRPRVLRASSYLGMHCRLDTRNTNTV